MNGQGGRALDGLGGRKVFQIQPNSEFPEPLCGSKTACTKVRGQKGNSPDRQLRSLNAG
jgi:hypothetical protein